MHRIPSLAEGVEFTYDHHRMDTTFLLWGLTIGTKKTKVPVVGRPGNDAAQDADSVITLPGDQLEVVSQLKYLGSIFTSDCTLDAEVKHTVAAGKSAFQQHRQANIWSSRALTLSVKMQFFQCIVIGMLERHGLLDTKTSPLWLSFK